MKITNETRYGENLRNSEITMLLSYELAKKLKEAGFEQNQYAPDERILTCCRNEKECKEMNGCAVYIPTLEELIEACGDDFLWLELDYGTWLARGKKGKGMSGRSGKSATEAVARLWLSLNKMKNEHSQQ